MDPGVGVLVEVRVVQRRGDGEGCGHLLQVNGLKENWIERGVGLKGEGGGVSEGGGGAGDEAEAEGGAGSMAGGGEGTVGVERCVGMVLRDEDGCVGLG